MKDPLTVIRRYFDYLEAGNFEAAVECFSEKVLYSHPPYRGSPPDSPRKEARGRAELLALFRERGKRANRHQYKGYVFGEHGFLSGTSTAPDGPTSSFVSEFTVDAAGLIDFYAAYQSIPAVGMAPRLR
jgi:hypothetical protein